MKYEIDEVLANEILRYLQQRPFIEVHILISKLASLKEIKNKEA